MNYNLISLKTVQLSKDKITKICKLKDTNWKFGIKSQLKWFKDNVKKNDIHNLLYFKSKLISFTFNYIINRTTGKNYDKYGNNENIQE